MTAVAAMMAAASAMTAASAANACGGGGCSSGSSGIVAAVELEAQDAQGVAVDVRIVVGAYKHLSIALQYAGATDTIKCTTFFIVCGVY